MNRAVRSSVPVLSVMLVALASACAVRLGGPSPEDYDAIALEVPANADATQVAQLLRDAEADLVLLTSERDSAWLASVATAAELTLSGPGTTSGRNLALMTRLEMLGDTSIVLDVPAGGRIHMHDALYRIDDYRTIDLMIVRIDAPDLRAAIRELLSYIATDVYASASILLAIDGMSPAAADSAAVLMRATLDNAAGCAEPPIDGSDLGLRLLYGPSARMTCQSAELLSAQPTAVSADVQVQR